MDMEQLQEDRNNLVRMWAKARVKEFNSVGMHPGNHDESELPKEAQERLQWFNDEHNRLAGLAEEMRGDNK